MSKIRATREYWEQRYDEWWDKPYHGIATNTEEYMTREEEGIRGKMGGLVDPSYRVLDAGCGYGRIAPLICPHVQSYVGVDYSSKAIEEARRNAPSNAVFRVGDMLEVTGVFDLIFMVGIESSLHYRRHLVIDHLRSLLDPDGWIVIFEYGNDRVISKSGTELPL
jgi:SAM-dependent methyltransferase